jgi:hypothetical protein
MTDLSPAGALLAASVLFAVLVAGMATARTGRRKPRRPPAGLLSSADELLAAARLRLQLRSFDRMIPTDRQAVVGLLERADRIATRPEVRARVNLLLAEMALVAGEREQALERFRAVLVLAPGAPVRRTVEVLERNLSPTTPLSVRLSA